LYAGSGLLRGQRKSGHVIVFHTGRSGSTVLGDMMDQHPQVIWGGEVFEMMLKRAARRQRRGIDKLYYYFSLDDMVRAVRNRMKLVAGARIYGLEVQGYHLDMMRTSALQLLRQLKPLGFNRFV